MNRPGAVLLAGATGLVGGLLLDRLLAPEAGPQVLAPLRRPLARSHRRVCPYVHDLADPAGDAALADGLRALAPRVDIFACCLGTTIRQAGSREAFLAVDRDLVLRLGAIARGLGARQAILVSSVGASAQSGQFYLRVKGEAERGLGELGFERVDLLRPGLLLGPRRDRRPAEALGQRLAPLLNPLMAGPWRKYRAIAADDVAAAAFALVGQPGEGRHVHEHDALLALAGKP